ncbi:MAG: hypothetical protein ACR2QQ_08885 [Gammaproteobacteria bacterium]
MIPRIILLSASLFSLGILGSAAAHHPPLMERCVIISSNANIEQIEWRMPHVELLVRTDGGNSYRLTWRNIHQLAWIGINRDTLSPGDEVVFTATSRRDVVGGQPMLLSSIRRISDGWEWSQDPQGC